jgi:hypothetical protein
VTVGGSNRTSEKDRDRMRNGNEGKSGSKRGNGRKRWPHKVNRKETHILCVVCDRESEGAEKRVEAERGGRANNSVSGACVHRLWKSLMLDVGRATVKEI